METGSQMEAKTSRTVNAAFEIAKRSVVSLGHASDFWPVAVGREFEETDVLREGAWVILCAGFRESVVRRMFGNLSICFCNWSSARDIIENKEYCELTALDVFQNKRKISAISDLAERISREGFEEIYRRIVLDPISTFIEFKYIGPITAFHLAKNLGFDVAKPDRHLQRIVNDSNFADVHELCRTIAGLTGERIAVVDGVFWRLSSLGLCDQFAIFDLVRSITRSAIPARSSPMPASSTVAAASPPPRSASRMPPADSTPTEPRSA